MEEKTPIPHNTPPSSNESMPTQVEADGDLFVSKEEGGSLMHYVVSQGLVKCRVFVLT